MIVPQFWAEGRIQGRINGHQVTVRRFGWSDASQQDAIENANARVQEAFARLAAGEQLVKRELKRAYNGADGVPIREEIVSRHGETIITRNTYGARCLNTPNVLFADIDFLTAPSGWFIVCVWCIWVLGGIPLGWWVGNSCFAWIVIALTMSTGGLVSEPLHNFIVVLRGGATKIARRRISTFVDGHPDWHMRLYRTPAGFRLLVMHQTFDPCEPAVQAFFTALGTDPVYVLMCLKQRCFRARVSPKPWRIGITAKMRPRPGVWPVNPMRLPERRLWIENYEQIARPFAACQFLEAVGSGVETPATRAVRELHDALCQANALLPIA